jgi:periplasmic divalent cation tolerance protein
MSEFAVVLCTTSADKAEQIARVLVKERLAACVNIVPISSCYIWEENINIDTEELMIIKTKQEKFEPLKKRILEMHSYKVPEIIALPIIEGHQPYLEWISQSVG